MIVVADTNVLISAMLWNGTPSLLLPLVEQGELQLVASDNIISEVDEVFRRRKFAQRIAQLGTTPEVLIEKLRRMIARVHPAAIPATASDPDDDVFLGTALAAKADVIVSGDKDLLGLRKFRGIPILTPAAFLRRYYPDISQEG